MEKSTRINFYLMENYVAPKTPWSWTPPLLINITVILFVDRMMQHEQGPQPHRCLKVKLRIPGAEQKELWKGHRAGTWAK